jgi:ubiquinone/menaquinone biosynthesis C-methylase UbiE
MLHPGELIRYLTGRRPKELSSAEGYNLWSQHYDDQPDNLMLALDEKIFTAFLNDMSLKGKKIVDVGCGTGRHWAKILEKQPETLIGYDVSAGMLDKLKDKFPEANTYQLSSNKLPELENETCDIVISTLTIAHIKNLEGAFEEWNRVLKKTGEIIITDYHPVTLANGGKRTFAHNGKTNVVKNYVHSLERILQIGSKMNWELVRQEEKFIDDSVKSYYEKKNALHIFEKFKGMPIIFGMHLKKKHVVI